MIDIHCHMLAGIDDGPATWEQALEMARIAVADGITHVVTTPHADNGLYETTVSTVQNSVLHLQNRLRDQNISLQVIPGMEIHLSPNLPERLAKGELSPLGPTHYVLVELPFTLFPVFTETVLRRLLAEGFQPIIAHPERNHTLLRKPQLLGSLVQSGVYTQITADSLLGRSGKKIQRFALYLLENGLAHLVASDAHNARNRTPRLSHALAQVNKLISRDASLLFFRRFTEITEHIINRAASLDLHHGSQVHDLTDGKIR